MRTTFQVVLPNPSIFPTARQLHLDHQISFWDAMLYAACVDAGVTTLYSEDLPGCELSVDLASVNLFT